MTEKKTYTIEAFEFQNNGAKGFMPKQHWTVETFDDKKKAIEQFDGFHAEMRQQDSAYGYANYVLGYQLAENAPDGRKTVLKQSKSRPVYNVTINGTDFGTYLDNEDGRQTLEITIWRAKREGQWKENFDPNEYDSDHLQALLGFMEKNTLKQTLEGYKHFAGKGYFNSYEMTPNTQWETLVKKHEHVTANQRETEKERESEEFTAEPARKSRTKKGMKQSLEME